MRFRTYSMKEGPAFRAEYWRGNDVWRASIHINHKWKGGHKWHLLFLPW